MKKTSTRLRASSILVAIAVILIAILSLRSVSPANAQSQFTSLTGWAWSDTIGWISMNCDNTSSCGYADYGISVGSDGTLSGYAWSDNIGWVSADHADVAYCETNFGGGDPQIQSNGQLTGWLRAISGNTEQSGDWDGCISLSGSNYGVTVASNGTFSGYAWGEVNVGWTDFSLVQESESPVCPIGYVLNGSSCVFSSCPAGYSQQTDQNGDQECVLSSCSLGFTLENGACTFTGCPTGYVFQDNFCVAGNAPSSPEGDIVAKPSLVVSNGSTEVSWSATGVSACSVAGSNGDGQGWNCTGGACAATTTEASSGITGETLYTLTCSVPGSQTPLIESTTVRLAPSFCETGSPNCN